MTALTSSKALNAEILNLKDAKGIDIVSDVRSDFDSFTDIYSYLQTISPNDFFLFALIAVGIVLIWQKLQISNTALIGLVVAGIFIYLFNENQRHTSADVNRDLMTQLHALDALTGSTHVYFYLDPEIIRFFGYNVDFRNYSTDAFDRCMDMTDSFMNLYYDLHTGTQSCSNDLQVASDLRKRIMNTWSEIDFGLPESQDLRARFSNETDTLRKILLDLLAEAQTFCKQDPLPEFILFPPNPSDFVQRTDYHVLN